MNLADSFLNPERLWVLLVVPVLIAAYWWVTRLKRRTGMRFTNTAMLDAVMPRQSQWRRHVAVALSLLSLAALIGAWARPNGIERVPRERATVVLVVDVSRSMEAKDIKPTRLQAAKDLSTSFSKQLPSQYNLALVSLSGSPSLKLPPTTDRALAQRAIEGLVPQDSTAIGEAVYVALNAIQMAPKAADGAQAPGAIVLLSDGQSDLGRSVQQAGAAASKAKVPIYTIAYGTANGSVDVDGKRYAVPPDVAGMQALASQTGGQASTAENAGQLDSVYKNLATAVGYEEVKKETTALWACYGLGFAVLAALAAVSLGARWP